MLQAISVSINMSTRVAVADNPVYVMYVSKNVTLNWNSCISAVA